GIDRAVEMLCHDMAGRFVDLDFRHRGTVGGEMRADADAAAGYDVGVGTIRARPSRLPICRLRRRIENAAPARIGDVALPKVIGVETGQVRELVDRLLGRE